MTQNHGLERARCSGSPASGREAAGLRRAGSQGSLRGRTVNSAYSGGVLGRCVVVSSQGWAGAAWGVCAWSTDAHRVRPGRVGRDGGRCAYSGCSLPVAGPLTLRGNNADPKKQVKP